MMDRGLHHSPPGLLRLTLLSVTCLAAWHLSVERTVAQGDGAAVSEQRLLIDELKEVQRANLDLAQQVADLQVGAAEALLAAAESGEIQDAELVGLAEGLARDAFVLASVPLAPIGTRGEAVSEALLVLIRQVVGQLNSVIGTIDDPVAAEAFEQFRASQLRAEELVAHLEAGWTRYGDLMRAAELDGRLPIGAYDPATRKWSLGPLPADTNTPGAAIVPDGGSGAASIGDRLPEEGGDQEGGLGQSWVVKRDANGFAAAVAADVGDPPGGIASVTVSCDSDGTLRYDFEARDALSEITISFGTSEQAFVAVDGSSVYGAQALRMSDALRLAYETAERVGTDAMAISSSDPPARALLPVSNYIEARGAVLDNCTPHEPAASAAPPANQSGPGAEDAPPPVPMPRPEARLPR